MADSEQAMVSQNENKQSIKKSFPSVADVGSPNGESMDA